MLIPFSQALRTPNTYTHRAKRPDTNLKEGKPFSFFREDIDDVETEISKEEAPGRNPISKLGKSKSEEVDTPSDRSSSGPTGKNYLNIPVMSLLRV